MSSRKNPALDAQHKTILKAMMQLPENKYCADCHAPSPRWASTNLGVFLCIGCSGIHRKIGVHVSKVRSVTLDVWTADQILHFQSMGNTKAAQVYEARLPPNFNRPTPSNSLVMEQFIRAKYEHRAFASPQHGATSASTTAAAAPPAQSAAAARAQAYVASNPRNQSLGPRPNIYDMLPRRNAYDTHSSNPNSRSYASQFLNPASTPVAAHHASPIVTALVEMGFPQELAVEAEKRHGHDLQSAADWVLRQKSVRLYSAPAPKRTTYQPPAPSVAPENLLDFSLGSVPSQQPRVSKAPVTKAAPKAFGTESLLTAQAPMVSTGPTVAPSSIALGQLQDDDDDDFTDFATFQSALPATNGSGVSSLTTTTNTQNTFSSITSSLAGLYAQGPPKSPMGIPKKSTTPLSPPRPPTGFPSTISSPLRAPGVGNVATSFNSPSVKPLSNNSTQAPLKTATARQPLTLDDLTVSPKQSSENGDNKTAFPTSVGDEKSPVSKAADKAEEEEDPFASLAFQALSAASSKKKGLNGMKASEVNKSTPSLVGDVAATNASVKENKKANVESGSTNGPGALSLEDLLG